MTAIGSSVSAFVESLTYRGREGHLSFIGHRLAGLGVLLFLAVHILDTSTVYFGKLLNAPDLYTHAIGIYRSTPFMLGEILLVAAVIYHGVNGLKIILYDTFPNWWQVRHERQGFWKVAIITVVLWAPAAFLMGRSMYWNNICHCAPAITLAEAQREIASATNFTLAVVPIAFVAILGVLAIGGQLRSQAAGGGQRVALPAKTFDTYVWQ